MNKFLLKINENDRDCVKYLDTEEEERKEIKRFEIVEKMFKKFNVVIDGKEIWKLIEDDINSTGKMDGVHSIELGKLGNDRDLYFAEVKIKMDYSEENDIYSTNISLLSIENDNKIIYPKDIKF